MSAQIAKLTGAWTTSVLPSQTTLTHIDLTNVYGLVSTLKSASAAYPTITNRVELYHLARAVKAAKASLLVISAENYIATATDTQDLPLMTNIIWNATMELQDLEMGFNLYQMQMSLSPNAIFAAIFAILLLLHTGTFLWKKYLYFGLCFAAGTGLECAGYAARVLSIGDYSNKNKFLCQIIALTLAPAVLMAGIYFLLAQLTVIHGRRFSVLKPLWFSYIFVVCDLCSLVIQAVGGGMAAIALENLQTTKPGTHVMVAGIAFQVLSMTLFMGLFFDFVHRIYFTANENVKFSIANLFRLFFQTKKGRELTEVLQQSYNMKYQHIWSRKLFGYFPLAILVLVFFIYIRCFYRLVELNQGWTGYLITHEQYVMTLDGLMVILTSALWVGFHPGFIMGRGQNISLSQIHNATDLESAGVDVADEKLINSSNWSNDSYFKGVDESVRQNEVPATPSIASPISRMSSRGENPFRDPQRSRSGLANSRSKLSRTHSRSDSRTQSFSNRSAERTEWSSYPAPGERAFGVINDGGVVAVPYDHTTAQVMSSPLPKPETPRKKRSKRLSHSTVASFNPYDRPSLRALHGDSLASTGPYEEFVNWHRGAELQNIPDEHDDVASQGSSDDESLFNFETAHK